MLGSSWLLICGALAVAGMAFVSWGLCMGVMSAGRMRAFLGFATLGFAHSQMTWMPGAWVIETLSIAAGIACMYPVISDQRERTAANGAT